MEVRGQAEREIEIAVLVLKEIAASNTPAERALKRAFRARPSLTNRQRKQIARSVHGVRCWRLRLAHLLERAQLSDSPEHLVAAHRVHIDRAGASVVARALGREQLAPQLSQLSPSDGHWPESAAHRISVAASVPLWLARALLEARGSKDALAAALALNRPGPVWLRANTLRNDRAALMRTLRAEGARCSEGSWAPHSIRLLERFDIRGSAAWKAGRFEVQDEGSQLIAHALAVSPGERVVDLCAGAGGKTLALAAAMEDRGELWAIEPNAQRVHDLENRTRRAELRSLRIVSDSALSAPLTGAQGADRVLVDAPCSEVGTLRRGPDRRWRIDPSALRELPELQLQLLLRGASLLRPGGRLVYATCTMLTAENAGVARAFGARAPDFQPVALLGASASRVQLWPHVHGTDGFFIAAWKRRGG